MIYCILSRGRQLIYCVIGITRPIHALDKNGTGLLMSKLVKNIIVGGTPNSKTDDTICQHHLTFGFL